MKTLIIILIFLSFNTYSQDYRDYYLLINKAEEQFVANRNSSCFQLYDSAFQKNTPFIKDAYIASQIAYYLKDSTRFYNYIGLCFSLGMPITSVNAAIILRENLNTEERRKINLLFEQRYKVKAVDSTVYSTICHYCYQSDSIKLVMGTDYMLNQKFYSSENNARQYILNTFLINGQYPNEHILPITSDFSNYDYLQRNKLPNPYANLPPATNKLEWELRVICPYNIVLHSHCFFQENKPLFYNAVVSGFLHPKEFAIMEEISIMWYKIDENKTEHCSSPSPGICYNIMGIDPFRKTNIFTSSKEGLEIVEKNRKEIFMQSYAIDLKKKQLEKDLGFAFFFDFFDRQ